MGHINLFNTFDEYKNDNNILMPNVTYIDSTETLIYGKKHVLRCTFEVTEDDLIENNYNPITLINGINLYSKEYTINGETISCKPFELITNSTDVSFEYNEELDGIFPNEDVFLPISSLNTDYKIKVNREISENDLVFMAIYIPEMNLFEAQAIPISDAPFFEKTNEELTYKLSVNLFDLMGDFPSSGKIAFVFVGEEIMNEDLNGLNLTKSITYTDYTLEDIVVYEPNIYEISFNYNLNTINFFQNYYLKSIIIPNSVTEISDSAFYECYKLSSIEIPKSIEYIGDYAFYYCSDLKKIKINSQIAPVLGNNVFGEIDDLYSLAGRNTYSLQINTLYLPMNHKDYDIDEQWFILLDKELCGFKIDGGNYNYNYVVDNSSHEYSIIYATYYMENDGICELFYDLNVLKSNVKLNDNTAYLKKGYNDIYFIIDSNTDIGDSAFNRCYNLTSIEIPDSVTSIGNKAFFYCTSLESIKIPDSVTSIGDSAFFYCTSLTSIEIPNSVTSIGDIAFYNCSSLTSIIIGDSVTSIGSQAFSYCTNLTSIIIGDSVTSIGDNAFQNCSSLTSIEITNSVTSIGKSAFNYCSSVESIIIGNSVTSIGKSAFSSCSSLTSIKIPDSVTSIGDSTFSHCSSLTSIEIPNSVTSIGNSAFNSCSSLTSIIIGNSVTSIGNHAFSYCTNLTSITCYAKIAPTICDYTFYYVKSNGTLIVPSGSDYSSWMSMNSYYLGYYRWVERYENIISLDFKVNSDSYAILIENICDYTDEYTINGKIIKCNLNDDITVTESGNYNISFIYNNDTIYDEMFYENSYLTSIDIPNSVTSIGSQAFHECESLTSITIPNSVTTIGDNAFSWCSSLTSIDIPNSVTSIGSQAFYECESLTSITIPNSVTSIGRMAFSWCSSLTSIDIPNSVTSISDDLFRFCESLTSITIPNSVTKIGEYAFQSCSSLTSIDIPNSVTSIGNYAFSNCSSLTSITCYATTAPTIYGSTFSNIKRNGTLIVPSGSNYSSWMNTSAYYLGHYDWTIQYM